MTELSVVGQSVIRLDAFDKVTGAAKFASDFMVGAHGVLEGKVLTSPYPHARILSIDTSEAQKLPDVKIVLTAKDTPEKNLGTDIKDQPLLARDVVRFIGDPVAVVAAETVEAAEKAISLIKVDYEELQPIFDSEEAMRTDSPVILHHDFEQYRRTATTNGATIGKISNINLPNVCATYKVRKGDVEKAFEEADVVVENRFVAPRIIHAQMEADYCIAQRGSDGTLTLWSSSKVIYRTKYLLADFFSLPLSKIRIVNPYVGGAFGRRPVIEQFCALLALQTHRPVRIVMSREDIFTNTHTAPASVTYIKDGLKKDGSLIAREVKLIINAGAYSTVMPRGILAYSQGAIATYRIPNFKMDSFSVYTNNLPTMTCRGVNVPQLQAALEAQWDIISHKLGVDPVELRKRNILNEGEENIIGETTHSIGVRECLDKVSGYIEWGKPSIQDSDIWRKGKGIAIAGRYGQGGTADSVHVQVYEDGIIEVRHGADEIGQGTNTVLAQMAAEEFGVTMDKLRVVRGDTAIVPYSEGASASRTTFYSGNATRLACEDAQKQIFALAAPRLGVSPHELKIADSNIFVKLVPEKFITISELFSLFPSKRGGEIIGKGVYQHRNTLMDSETGQIERMQAFYMYGANAVEVAVNIRTGEIKILKVGSAWDMGQPINPKLCEGQIEGGLSWGIGMALTEEMKIERGRVLNPNFRDYKIPRADQMPDRACMESFLVMDPHNEGPFGAKGMGEVTLMANNAVFNAIGVRLYEFPLTPEKILRHLKDKGGSPSP
ncbi:xanthine dehydrogenase family protein molybdopterin-binding subunit [Chloroflexota bacterium]